MKKILVCINASPDAQAIMDMAGYCAKLHPDNYIELLHVLKPSDNIDMIDYSSMMSMNGAGTFLDDLLALDGKKAQIAFDRGEIILQNAITYLRDKHNIPEEKIVKSLKRGYFTDIAHESEQDAILTIIGKRGENSLNQGKTIGAHLEKIIRGQEKPIMVATGSFKPIKKALVAFDNSEKSLRAINFLNTHFFNDLSVVDLLIVNPDNVLANDTQTVQDIQIKFEVNNIKTVVHFENGDVEEIIGNHLAQGQHELLVAGAYGHSTLRNFFLGSTTNNIIKDTSINILFFN